MVSVNRSARSQPSERMVELDVLRGLAVAIMIMVVSPGSWEHTYTHLQHADWHGWSVADFVFPDFLFGVGVALGLTFGHSLDPMCNRRAFWRRIAKRVTLLLLLGLALNYLAVIAGMLGAPSVGPTEETNLRIPGVLQRIGVCYLLAVSIVWATSTLKDGAIHVQPLPIIAIIAAILIVYWAVLSFVPVPGYGAGALGKVGNLPAYIDRIIFTPQHMWPLGAESWRGPVVYDPEGILSSLPATANILIGVLVAGFWRTRPNNRMILLALAGVGMIVFAALLDSVFPINKKLWTSTFVLLSAGVSCLALLFIAALFTLNRGMLLLATLRILGGNAILAFSISIFLSAIASIPLSFGKNVQTLQQLGFRIAHGMIADPYLASLVCALAVLSVILLLLWPLHRKDIHLRL